MPPSPSQAAKLNIQADALTQHTAYVECPHPTVTPLSPEVFTSTLSLNSVAVTSDLQEIAVLQYYTPALLQYFQATPYHGWSPHTVQTIDWLSTSRDLVQKLSYSTKQAIFKLVNGQWPTYKQLQRRRQHPPHCHLSLLLHLFSGNT